MKKEIFLPLLLLLACNYKGSNCKIYANELLKKYPQKVYIAYHEGNKILGISDYGIDNGGGAYYFYPTGQLKYYKFFHSDSAYNYSEEYDANGKFVKAVGQPLVDESTREVNKDSAILKFYLFALHKTYYSLKISLDNNSNFDVELKDDTSYSNMKVASVGFSTKNLSHFKVLFSCSYVNECNSKKGIVHDALSFVKNPRLNLEE